MSAPLYDENEKPHSAATERIVRWTVFSILGGMVFFRYFWPLFKVHRGLKTLGTLGKGAGTQPEPAQLEAVTSGHVLMDVSLLVLAMVGMWLSLRAMKKERMNGLCVLSMFIFLLASIPGIVLLTGLGKMLPFIAVQATGWLLVGGMAMGFGVAGTGIVQFIRRKNEFRGGLGWGLSGFVLNGLAFLLSGSVMSLPWSLPHLPKQLVTANPELKRLAVLLSPFRQTSGERPILEFASHNFRILGPAEPWIKLESNDCERYGCSSSLTSRSSEVFGNPLHESLFFVLATPLPEGVTIDATQRTQMNQIVAASASQSISQLGISAELGWAGEELLKDTSFVRFQLTVDPVPGKSVKMIDCWASLIEKSAVCFCFFGPLEKEAWLSGEARKVAESFEFINATSSNLAQRKPEAEILHQKSIQASSRRDFAAACDLAKQAFEQGFNDAELLAAAVRSQLALNQQAVALTYLEQYINKFAQNTELRLLHAQLLGQSGRSETAAKIYEELLPTGQGTEQDVQNALSLFSSTGELKRALALADILVIKKPFPKLRRWRASLQAQLGDTASAIPALQGLVGSVPFDPMNAYKLGEVANQAGMPQVALEAVQKLIETGNDSARTRVILGRALFALGQQTEAQKALAVASQLAPNDPSVQAAMADIRGKSGQPRR